MENHKAGNIHKNSHGLRRWELANTPDNQAYVPLEAQPQIPIEGINITDIGTEFFEEVRESYKQEKNFHIFYFFLDRDCKDTSLVSLLDAVWKNSYSEGIFHFFDGILYRRTKHSCHLLWTPVRRQNTQKSEKLCMVPFWRKETIEYFNTCDRCQKANRSTAKKFGLIIHIQEPRSLWEFVHMDWFTALAPSGDKRYDSCLVIVDRYI
ncbi:hypothetical protein O181_087700 [Austropuccinia psidii MF-1]|uniref:Integrase zinc-binding domain-containing protein n=1 Tax=Austropuccinia psidii MF-1 TaxID=1389203 RepID=A0A9Q3P2E5_9BASI|nr:hypothetical protein [Austropuccinia psidii MF-1]